jgi:periplasmic protein TonB
VTTPPNPQQLLRRPKKPAARQTNAAAILGGALGVLVIVVAVVGFFVFGHGKSAALDAGPPVAQAAGQQAEQSYAPSYGSTAVKRSGRKSVTPVKPVLGSSPTPLPSPTATPTTGATPTPQNTSAAAQAAAAKAKHQAALHLAAIRRLEAAQANANANQSTSLLAGTTSPALQSSVASQPVATEVPTAQPAAATPDAEPTPVYAPRVVVDARFVDRVAPVYPDIAREQGAQGTAIVLATVGPKGNVISVALDQSAGNKMLDQSALAAARGSRFQPPEIGGKPATETYRIVYTFDPNS